jgi:hypothetical protein
VGAPARLDDARALRLRLAAARRRAGDPDLLRAAAAEVSAAERALDVAEARYRWLRQRADTVPRR